VAEISYTAPRPTYFVTYSGTTSTTIPFVIPNIHRREGDTDDNPLVRVIIQNTSNTTGVQMAVLDETNAPCLIVFPVGDGGRPEEIETDSKLKLLTNGVSNATFLIMAFYAKPLGR